jgi:phosphinothricin acetyltransferase
MEDLIDRARALGHHAIIALIDAEQTGSVIMHEKSGFKKAGHLHQVGYKFNHWLDVIYMELLLR